jgi:tetratricopeptide (TPR) repeat protein
VPLPGDSGLLEPTPEALAERLLELGDPDSALEVLDRALRRDPGSDRARALRSRALLFKRNEHALTPRPSAAGDFDEDLAEALIQRGFLDEARIV